MKKFKFKTILYYFYFSSSSVTADTPYYLDFKYILNESDAGKKAQKQL